MGKEGKFEIIKSYKKFSFIFWLFLNIRRGRFRDGWWHTYILILGLCFLFVMQTFTFRFLLNAPSELKRTPETTLLGNLGNIECPFVLVFIAGFAKICYVIECFINSGKVPFRFHFSCLGNILGTRTGQIPSSWHKSSSTKRERDVCGVEIM